MGFQMDPRRRSAQPPVPYSPRRSNRVDESAIELTPDGDVWQEKICVCEGLGGKDGKTPRLILKSYYRNNRTLHKVWDEPPTGASTVRYASSKDRRKAEAQLKELQSTLNMIPADAEAAPSSSPQRKKNAVEFFLGVFQRSRNKPPAVEVHDAQDVNLQKAIAMSMVDRRHPQENSTTASSSDESIMSPKVRYDPDSPTRDLAKFMSDPFEQHDDDEEAALAEALALSLSDSYVPSAPPREASEPYAASLSEDELVRRAIIESQRTEERRKSRATFTPTGDSPRRHSLTQHERRYESKDRRSHRTSGSRAVHDADDVYWDRKPTASNTVSRSRRHSDSRPYVTDDPRLAQKSTHNHRKVTRVKDPPSDPPPRYMEDDDEDDVDFEVLYNEVDDDILWKTKRASSHQRGSNVGRTLSGRKAY